MKNVLAFRITSPILIATKKYIFGILIYFFSCSSLFGQETCNNGIDDDGDGFVDCYDSDCIGNASCDDFFIPQTASCQYEPGIVNFGMSSRWQTDDLKYDIFSTVTPISADLDNDGVVEILVLNHNGLVFPNAGPGNKIYILNGNNGAVEDSIVMPVNAPTIQTEVIAIGDLDNDGFGEIVIMGNDSQLRCYEHTTVLKWTSPALPASLTPVVSIADFNQDGNAEVYCSTFIFNGQTGAQIIAGSLPPTGSVGAPIAAGILNLLGMTVAADVLPSAFCADCGGLELVAGNKVYSVNLATGNLVEQVAANAPGADGFTTIADYDKDGDLDAIVATDAGSPGESFVYVWDILTSTVMAVSPTFSSATSWTIGQCTVGDFDGDGLPEVGVVTEDSYHVLDDHTTSLASLWTKTVADESGFTNSSLFDFQGDGITEIVYQDEDSLYVINGATGSIIASRLCRNGSLLNRPVVLDVNGDGQAEIVCGCSQGIGDDQRLHGYIEVFGSAGEAWVDARSLWNQSSYFVTNINDDLSVPLSFQNHSIVGNGIVLNAFNLQSTILESNGDPTFAAPDASATIVNVNLANCGSGPNTIEVTIKIENLSMDALLPIYNPVALYNGDPSLGGATLIDTVMTTSSIPALGEETMNITIPDQGGNFTLYVVANDTGHLVTPVAFPNTGVGECSFANNIVFQLIDCSPPCVTNTWVGSISNDWFTPANWSCAEIPDATIDVIIPMGTPPCLIMTGMMAFAKTISVETLAVFTVDGTLEVDD